MVFVSNIEVFADVVCPFTHVGLRRLSDARRASDTLSTVVVRAWPLEWINRAPLDRDLAAKEITALRAQVAPDLFAGFDPATFPQTSIPAFGLAAAGYETDDATGEAVSLALRDALFERGEDISDHRILAAIASRFGIEPLDPAATKVAVDADWGAGRTRGVKGSPHFFVGDRGWFCPSLDVSHDGDQFEVQFDLDTMAEFQRAALA